MNSVRSYYDYRKYVYDGCVLLFDNIIATNWHGETVAPTKAKARSNLIFQFKKQNGLAPSAKVSLNASGIKCVEKTGGGYYK